MNKNYLFGMGIVLAMLLIVAPASGQPTSFLIDGWIHDSSGDPVNDPAVVITNTNAGEVFAVGADVSSNYYHAITCSDNVSTGDVLSFSVNGGTTTNHAVTQDEMNAGGFEENLTVEASVEPDFIEIGDGTETEYYVPFHGNWDYGWSKIIYTKSEIGAPITITSIAFNVSKPAGYSYAVNDQRIYMAHTTDASFDGDVSKPDPSTLTEVYNGGITWESGWTIITLDTSFPYNNVDNLLIYYENQDGSYESNQPLWYRTLTLPDYRSVYNYADGSFPTGDGDQVRFIPNIQLHYGGVATGIAVSKTVYDPDAGEWADSISGAIPGETYRFKIDVTATGCDLTDVVISDTLSQSLSYAGNPSPSAPAVIGDVYQWTFETLNGSETRTIEFDATVSYRGLDCNLASATGWCNETVPEQFSNEDTACIDSRVDLAVKSDWNEHIKVNPACNSLDYYRIIVNESNTIRVWIVNNGPSNITSGEEFNVCFDLNGVGIACETVTGPLNAGEDVYFDIEMTPDCTPRPEWPNYPPVSGYPCECITPGYRLNVTVDASSVMNETDEDNNLGWRAVSICCNGYKSKNFDCGADDPLTLFESEEFYGGVVYNVSGKKTGPDTGYAYYFTPGSTDTRVHNINVPGDVVEARLYVYWYDFFGNPSPGCMANMDVNFSGTSFTTPTASYNDQKGLGSSYNLPKGTYAYNVTSLVIGSGDYTVVVKNIDPTNSTVLLGEMLVVVYEDPSQNPDNYIRLWMMEGCDLLMESHGTYQYCVDVNESTATVAFPGTVADVTSAELITVVSQGMEYGNNLFFNGDVIKTDAWDPSSEAGPKSIGGEENGSRINVEVADVTDNMTSSDNTVGFQDTGTNGMQASNAFLVVKCTPEVVPISCELSGVGRHPGHLNSGGNLTLTARVKNTGGSLVYCQMDWQIKDGSGTVVETIPGDNFTEEVGNGPTKTIKLRTVDLGAGSYTVTGILRYGATAGNLDCTDGPVNGGGFTVV